jgi:hypothetical protein
MAYETKDNSGSVFQNERKEKDTHPDRTGQAKIGGVDYWVSGWIKQDRNGKPYLSLAFKPKEGARTQSGNETAQSGSRKPEMARDMDDEIPF